MLGLFNSSEHNERQIGVKIFGCLLGLRVAETKSNKIEDNITENLKYLKTFTDKVFEMTYDWDETTAEIAEYLCEICMSK